MPDPTGGFAGVGCFGKLPGAGDFVQRRLPARFVERWDGAFEAAVDAARQAFGDGWPEAWRDAPVWRFALAPGVVDAAAWVGVTGPSTDRVGRRFPMLLAAPLADAASVAQVLRAGGCWFDALERTHRAAQGDVTTRAEAFDARVAALPGPLEALHGHASALPPLDWSAGGHWRLPLPQGGGEGELAAWWTAFAAACGEACLWWTRGAARMPPSVLLTRGLPQPAAYAGFLDAAHARAPWQSQGTFGASLPAAPAMTQPAPAPLPDELDDVLADLLAMPPAAPSSLSMPSASPAAVSAPAQAAPPPTPATGPGVAVPATVDASAGAVVIHRAADALTLVAADDGADDPRRHAAAAVGAMAAALAGGELAAGLRPLRDRLLDLHPRLHQRREDLIDPVAEDGAVIAARIAGGWAELLRVGTAAAWHWRRGQLQPLFATGAPAPSSDDDTARPGDFGDLLFSRASPVAPGLGAAAAPSCDEVVCAVQPGDRLLLLATAALTPLPPDVFARALAMPSCDDARARIATAASLGTEPSRWPLAVIEVGT
jgi:type VI secretion system ImpM family protein